jgi:hypothetical protein
MAPNEAVPDEISPTRCPDGAGWNNKRPDGEAVILKLCGNGVETKTNVSALQKATGFIPALSSPRLKPPIPPNTSSTFT